MFLQSVVEARGLLPPMPTFTGERIYMRPFTREADLGRWTPTVLAMLDGIEWDGDAYLMVDQQRVVAGETSRRPGLHVDGWWDPGVSAHGGVGRPPSHRARPTHRQAPPRHQQPSHMHGSGWKREGILLASDVQGCRAFAGLFPDDVGERGNCAHLDGEGMTPVVFDANRVYAGNVTMLHESLPVVADCLRTVVRINVPGWEPAYH